jgi:integrase
MLEGTGRQKMKSERERKTRKDNRGRLLKKGEGQDKNGRYYFIYTGRDGKRHRIYNMDLIELREQAKGILRDIEDGIDVDAGKRTLNEQFERYMSTKDIKQSTRSKYNTYWNREVRDSIGRKRLSEIKKSDLQIFYKSLKNKGLADGTIKVYSGNLINPVLELAFDDDIIRKNPNKGCMKEYTDKPKEKEVLTQEQQDAFLEYVKNSKKYGIYYPMFQVMFSTAFRFSELAGLTWNDVDFDDRTISLNHQVYYMDYGDGYKYHCESPKSDAGVRVIPMTQNCYKALKLQREYQFAMGVDREKETAGLKGFVFTTTRGTPYNTQNIWTLIRRISNRYNEEELESAEKEGRVPVIMPDMSSHTFRHTGCTRLAETKMDVKSLQEFMGHSDIKVTMDVYDHIVGNRMKNEIEEAERKNDAI